MTFFQFWRTYVQLVWPFKWHIAWALFWIVLAAVVDLVYPYMLKVIFDLVDAWVGSNLEPSWSTQVLTNTYGSDRNGLIYSAVAVLGLFFILRIIQAVIEYFSKLASLRFELEAERTLPVQVLEKLLSLSYAFHTNEHSGKKIEKIKKGTEAVGQVTYISFFHMIPTAVRIPVFLGMAFYFDWRIALALVVFMPIMILQERYAIHLTASNRRERHDEYENANSQAFEALSHIFTVWAFGQEGRERDRYEQRLSRIQNLSWDEQRVHHIARVSRTVMMAVTTSVVIGLCLYGIDQGRTSSGTLIMLVNLSNMIVGSTGTVVSHWNLILQQSEPMERVFKVMQREAQITQPEHAVTLDPLRGSLTFENVSFSYPDRKKTLSAINMAIPAGTTAGIVGESGCGKSTLLMLIMRLVDVDSGTLMVDGCDIRRLDLQGYRHQIGFVPQSVELFATTIAKNIAYGRPDASKEELIEAAKQANAHEFISKLADGYDTVVGERGAKLSGGQRQRISIARALLIDPRILIFDEATSDLDAYSEAKIQEALAKISLGRTTVIVAQRLSTIRDADQIFYIDEGQLVEEGTWKSLMALNGKFRELYDKGQVEQANDN